MAFAQPIRASLRMQRPCVSWILQTLSGNVFLGANVLHFRSVELAQSQNVPLVIKKSGGG